MVMQQHPAGHRGGPGLRRDAHLPHPDLPREGGRQLQPRRPQLRPVQAGHARAQRQAPVPQLQLPGRAVQPAVLQARPPRDRDRLHGLPHARDGQRLRPRPRDHARAAATCRFTSINLPRLAIAGQGRRRRCSSTSWTRKLELVVEQLDWSASRSRRARRCTTSRSSWARACGWTPRSWAPTTSVREVLKHGTLSIGLHRPGRDARWR